MSNVRPSLLLVTACLRAGPVRGLDVLPFPWVVSIAYSPKLLSTLTHRYPSVLRRGSCVVDPPSPPLPFLYLRPRDLPESHLSHRSGSKPLLRTVSDRLFLVPSPSSAPLSRRVGFIRPEDLVPPKMTFSLLSVLNWFPCAHNCRYFLFAPEVRIMFTSYFTFCRI